MCRAMTSPTFMIRSFSLAKTQKYIPKAALFLPPSHLCSMPTSCRWVDRLRSCSLFDRLRSWLDADAPPLPSLTDLDRSEDGMLDLRQHWLSGSFVSARLESAYTTYTLAVWRPRLRTFFVFLAIVEGANLTKGLLCSCGLRFESFHGWALVYAFAFLMSSILFTWLILSPKFVQSTSKMMPWVIPAAVIINVIGYALPLGLYLDQARPEAGGNNASLAEDAAAMQLMKLSLVDQGAWFSMNIVTFTLLTALAGVTFGVGAVAITLIMPVAISFYLYFERIRFDHQYGIVPSLVPQSVIVYALCTILAFCHAGSTRKHFIVRIYIQHERDLRVEQLEREKERLDYERRFALQTRSDSGRRLGESCDAGSSESSSCVSEVPHFALDLTTCCGAQGESFASNEGRGLARPVGLAPTSNSTTSEPELTSICWHAIATMEAPSERSSWGAAMEAASVASDSSVATFKTGDFISEEREQALVRTLNSVGIEFPSQAGQA